MLSLAGRVALVTGGSRGIGRAVSVMLARVGAKVAVNYRTNEAAATETVEAVRAGGGTAVALPGDVSRPEEASRLVTETEARLGPLDVLVVNHGIWLRASIETMTPDQWEETLRVNLRGAYAICHYAARVMIPRGRGAIVTIASTAGHPGRDRRARGLPGLGPRVLPLRRGPLRERGRGDGRVRGQSGAPCRSTRRRPA